MADLTQTKINSHTAESDGYDLDLVLLLLWLPLQQSWIVIKLIVTSMLGLPNAHLRAVPGKHSCTRGWIKGAFFEVDQVAVCLLAAAHSVESPGYKVHTYCWALLQACPLQRGDGYLCNCMLNVRDMAPLPSTQHFVQVIVVHLQFISLIPCSNSMTDLAA